MDKSNLSGKTYSVTHVGAKGIEAKIAGSKMAMDGMLIRNRLSSTSTSERERNGL